MLKSSHAQFQITKLIVLVFVAFTHNAFAADDSEKTIDWYWISQKELEAKYTSQAERVRLLQFFNENEALVALPRLYNADLKLFDKQHLAPLNDAKATATSKASFAKTAKKVLAAAKKPQKAERNYQAKIQRYKRLVRHKSPHQSRYFETVIKPAQKALTGAQNASAQQGSAEIQEKTAASEKECCCHYCCSPSYCCLFRRK